MTLLVYKAIFRILELRIVRCIVIARIVVNTEFVLPRSNVLLKVESFWILAELVAVAVWLSRLEILLVLRYVVR